MSARARARAVALTFSRGEHRAEGRRECHFMTLQPVFRLLGKVALFCTGPTTLRRRWSSGWSGGGKGTGSCRQPAAHNAALLSIAIATGAMYY